MGGTRDSSLSIKAAFSLNKEFSFKAINITTLSVALHDFKSLQSISFKKINFNHPPEDIFAVRLNPP